ncbi:MAG: PAS domain S-box protein [Geobacter sp.]|nr:PAS domain S-box protein [Geobacter sp.]
MKIEQFENSGVWQPYFRVNTQGLLLLVQSSPLGIVAIDLDGRIQLWNKAAEETTGWREDEVIGRSIMVLSPDAGEAYEALRRQTLQKQVFTSMPLSATRRDGSNICISYSAAPLFDSESSVIGTVAILYDITEKTALEAALKGSLEKMNRVVDETVHALATAIEKRDPYTAGHQQRVAQLAQAIAVEMGDFDDDRIKGIHTVGIIHDIGKLYVPNEILSKPGQLMDCEFELIKTHPQAGCEILQKIEFPWPIAQAVQQHHERLDGSGYPAGLVGEDILLEARIVGVADVVEAMSSHRPYRPCKGQKCALQEIEQGRGGAYDSRVVDACLTVFKNGYLIASE